MNENLLDLSGKIDQSTVSVYETIAKVAGTSGIKYFIVGASARDKILNDCLPILANNPHVEKIIRRLQSDNFEKTLTFMDYENLDSTSNQVERTNRWFRKRQKTHYRNRKEENIVNMLKADLIGQMERDKDKPPVKLIPNNLVESKTA